jgi:hypothetical protein
LKPASTRTRLVAACLLCAALRLPALEYGVISDDEAIYDAMAGTLASGGVMYRDTVDHKPPGLAYTYALLHRVAGGNGARAMALVHLLGLAAAVATCLALFGIARRTLRESLWAVPSLLYAVISACKQPADGLAVNGELLMNLPCALCALCAIEALRAGPRAKAFLLDVGAGALGAAAALYKYQAAAVLFALPALWLEGARAGVQTQSALGAAKRLLGALGHALAALLGTLLTLAAVAAYFRSRGVLGEAFAWGIGFNRSYVAEGPPPLWALGRFGLSLAGVVLPGALLYGGGLAGLRQLFLRRVGGPASSPPDGPGDGVPDVISARDFLGVWTLLSIASVFIGLRFFGHYFLQPELPLSLLAAGPTARLFKARPRLARAALFLPALVFLLLAALPGISRPLFNARDPDYTGIGRAIEARTSPGDTIWVWGNVPQLYYASSRSPGVRFSFCNYLTGLSPGTPSEYDDAFDPRAHAVTWAWALALQDLDQKKPALVLDTAAAGIKSYGKFPISAYPAFARYLDLHYRSEGAVEGVVVYRRREGF